MMELINENDLQNICAGGFENLRSAAAFFLIVSGVAILCSLSNKKAKKNDKYKPRKTTVIVIKK